MNLGQKRLSTRFNHLAISTLIVAAMSAASAYANPLQGPWLAAQNATVALLAQTESAPVAIFTITPQQPLLGQPFQVDGSVSFDRPSNGPISSYAWNWGDGTAAGNGVFVQHTYATASRYTITLTVADGENPPNTNSTTKTVVITSTPPPPDSGNRAPVASMIVTPAAGKVGDDFEFDASASTDPDSDPLVYRFDFGDGKDTGFIADSVVTHAYANPGTYAVRLTVRDDANASSDFASTLQVTGPPADNQAPVALIAVGPRTGSAPVTLNFDGRLSYDPDGDPIAYQWSFTRDGESYAEQTGSVVNQLFSEPGSYSVVLEVTDSNDATGASAEQTITITPHGEEVEPPPPAPVPQPEPPPPSYLQRPNTACGMGLLMPMLACLMGLLGGRFLTQRLR